MEYYSGCSRREYNRCQWVNTVNPSWAGRISCYDSETFGHWARGLAEDFARKRARQDDSEPVVIEITRPEEFTPLAWEGFPVFVGRLNPDNHKVHYLKDSVLE